MRIFCTTILVENERFVLGRSVGGEIITLCWQLLAALCPPFPRLSMRCPHMSAGPSRALHWDYCNWLCLAWGSPGFVSHGIIHTPVCCSSSHVLCKLEHVSSSFSRGNSISCRQRFGYLHVDVDVDLLPQWGRKPSSLLVLVCLFWSDFSTCWYVLKTTRLAIMQL